ncbi:MAG: molybdopterin converting factor subunit 1 [Myxococcales bacterium]|nr:molybdopterin converting factor subunit 1 [Myxococcales bacterium]
MRIQVLYFAFFRERLATSEQILELENGATVGDALEQLAREHEAIAAMRGRFRAAVNQEMIGNDLMLEDGDELALIPPVAGGSDDPEKETKPRYAIVMNEALSLDRVIAAVQGDGMGGIVTFVGQVRDFNDGHEVVRLEYEAYAEMANKVMARLCSEIEEEVPGARLAVEHRTGVLDIGDEAVVIAAAAPHRAEAFTACRNLIDRLKDHVPIWKKEVAPSGEEWIGMGP